MAKRDYYEVLGISKGCAEVEIKRAYRDLAMKHHPDKNKDDPDAMHKMKEINEAYAVLSDSKKKQIYDTYGHRGLEGYSTEDIFRGVDFESILREFGGGFSFSGSILDSLFGMGQQTSRKPQRGEDLRYDMDITLEEVAHGAEKLIKVPHKKTCSTCKGSGAKEGGQQTCEYCHGTGQVVKEQRTGFGVFRQISVCPHCRGTGKLIKDKCEACKGKGAIQETTEINVQVPKGAESGHAVKIKGEGEAGPNGTGPGDLYIVFNVEKHPLFERHGDDIYMAKEISFADAALGAELDDIPSLNGKLKIEIPEGTQTGTVLRVPDKGIPHMKGAGKGDLYVLVKVVTPQHLTSRQKELLREFAGPDKSK
jgi:molecular chaperone DnaJ